MVVYGSGSLSCRDLLALALEEVAPGADLSGLRRTDRGKPYLPGGPHVSWSHSGSLSLCALGETPVGADVEVVKPRGAGLPRYVLSEEEYAFYREQGGAWPEFYALWTLKESRVKWSGEGLQGPPRRISVPLLHLDQGGALAGLHYRLYGGTHWRAAVCGTEPPPETIRWRGEEFAS